MTVIKQSKGAFSLFGHGVLFMSGLLYGVNYWNLLRALMPLCFNDKEQSSCAQNIVFFKKNLHKTSGIAITEELEKLVIKGHLIKNILFYLMKVFWQGNIECSVISLNTCMRLGLFLLTLLISASASISFIQSQTKLNFWKCFVVCFST